ncbi:hypothetical protein [Methanopyrus sp.]
MTYGTVGTCAEPSPSTDETDSAMIAQSAGVNPERAHAELPISGVALVASSNTIIFGFVDDATALVEREIERTRYPESLPLIDEAREDLIDDNFKAYVCELTIKARVIISDIVLKLLLELRSFSS